MNPRAPETLALVVQVVETLFERLALLQQGLLSVFEQPDLVFRFHATVYL